MKPRHWSTSRKWLAFLISTATLTASAVMVKNGNYPALATAVVALFGAFSAGNVVAGALGPKDGA